MNAEQLLAHFEWISEAPDAITRLRRFILDLAVRGKLVEQDPEDEPAEELLKRIADERARLVKTGEIKAPKIYERRVNPNVSLHDGWLMVPLSEIVNHHLGGGTPSKSNLKYWNGHVLWASVKDVGKRKYLTTTIDRITEEGLADSSSNLIPPGNLLVVTRMGLGKVSINQVPVAINQDLRALFMSSMIDISYCYNFFLTHGFEGSGLTVKGIKIEELLNIPFPLPPLAEQHRIVAKVDELMALCDQLEAARQQREQGRERLMAATLQRLNQPAEDPASFRQDASFALQVLPSLTTTPAQIKQLRQTILNLAVRGKLVEQDPEDEPVESYLKLIKAQPIDHGDFGIPCQWAWVSVGEVSSSRLGKMLDKAKNKGTERPYLRNINVRWLDFDLSDLLEMRFEESELSEYELKKGDVLICEGGEPGRAAVWDDRARGVYFQKAIHRVRFDECVDPFFFVYVLRCSALDERLSKYFTGTGISHFTGKSLKGYLFPLPPLAEQHRIVAKVDELMALCDQLEQQLSQADQQRRRLLEAVLTEALGGRLPTEQEESHAAIA